MSQPDPALSVDQLRAQIADGSIDTVVVAFPDMQGRLQGKRLHAQFFLDTRSRARDRGLQLPAGRRRGHEHGRGLRHQLLGARLRRHGVRARSRHAASRALDPRHRHADLRSRLARRRHTARWSRARARCCAPGRPAAEQGLVAFAGTELEFIVFNDTYEQAWDLGLPRPDPRQPVQRRLLVARHQPGRAAAARHPQRHVRGRSGGRSRPRASATSASTRSRSSTTRSCAPATTTRSTRTAPRRSPPSTARR